MSASREKKMRQQNQTTASAKKATSEKKAPKTALYVVIAIVAIALVVFATMINSGLFEATTNVATVGARSLTAAEMNYWLMDTYSQEQSNAGFASMVDAELPLNEQACPEEGYETWYDYMLKLALESAANTYAVYDKAVSEGLTLSESGQASIDSQIQMLEMYAPMYGFADVNSYLAAAYGAGCKLSTYKEYLNVTTLAQEYETAYTSEFTFTADELDAYYTEHAAEHDVVRFRVFNVPGENAAADALAMANAAKAGGEEAFLANALTLTPDDQKETYDAAAATLSEFMTVADAQDLYDCEEFASEDLAYGDVFVAETDNGSFVIFILGKVTKDAKLPNVRHILIMPEAAEDGSTTPEAWENAKTEAEAVLAEYHNGEKTEDAFATLADSKSTDTGSVGNGGLYEKIDPMQMVAPFANWCFDAHQPGDTGIVKTDYGYHVMYFSGESDVAYGASVAENALRQAKYDEWISEIQSTVTYALNSKKYITVI